MSALGYVPNDKAHRKEHYRDKRANNQRKFLAAYALSGKVGEASRWAHVERTAHAMWMKEDPTYPPRFLEARQRAAQTLEDEAVRRAKDGVKKVLFYKGEPVRIHGEIVYEVEYSDRLLERLLEANDPDRFKRHTEHTNLLDLDPAKLTTEQLGALAQLFIKSQYGTCDPGVLAEARKQIEAAITAEQTDSAVELKLEVVGGEDNQGRPERRSHFLPARVLRRA